MTSEDEKPSPAKPCSDSDARIAPGQNQAEPAPAEVKRTQRAKLVAGAIAACSVVLIAVSVGALAGVQLFGSPQTQSGQSDAVAVSASAESGTAQRAPESASSSAVSDFSTQQNAEPAADAGSASSMGSDHKDTSATDAEGPCPVLAEASQAPASGQQTAPQAAQTITVQVTVDSSAANGSVSANTRVSLASGATVYDALAATGLSLNTHNSAYGIYVAGIGGLNEKQFGGKSGWVYAVNGVNGSVSAGSQAVQNGDVVSWSYVAG